MRPTLEYAATVWDPHKRTHIDNLEKNQRRAARFVMNQHDYTSMLEELGWSSLQQRRRNKRLSMLYKIINNIVRVQPNSLKVAAERRRRCHSKQYERIPSRTEYRLHSFFPQTIREWNALTEDIVSSQTVSLFNKRVRDGAI